MTPSEAIAQIRAILSRLEAPQSPAADPGGQSAPVKPEAATGDSRLSFRDASVIFYEVGKTKSGRDKARIGIEWKSTSGRVREYYDCYDMKVVEAFDPLNKGDRVQLTLKPWNDTHIVSAVTVVERSELKRISLPAADLDEIPF